MFLGVLLFALNDVMGKWLVATYSVGQVLLMRSFAALLVLAPFMVREGKAKLLRPPRLRLQILRVMASTFEVACFYWAVVYFSLADVMTAYLASPIYVTAAAAIFLRERVSWQSWLAVLMAFVGVVVALGPFGKGWNNLMLIALVGSACYAVLILWSRMLRGTSDVVLVTWQTVGALLFGVVAAPVGWVTPSPRDFALLSLLGIVAMAAHVCVNRSLKLAPASVVVPYQYMLIVWAVLFGWLVFGDRPSLPMVAGAAIIIGAGLWLFWQDQRASAKPEPRSTVD